MWYFVSPWSMENRFSSFLPVMDFLIIANKKIDGQDCSKADYSHNFILITFPDGYTYIINNNFTFLY